MGEVTWIEQMLKYAPAWLVAAYFGYKILVKAIDAWRIKKLEKQGIKVNGRGHCKTEILSLIGEVKKRQQEDREHYDKELRRVMECATKDAAALKEAIHEQIDDQTKILAEKHDRGNGILKQMLGKLETMCTFLAGRNP